MKHTNATIVAAATTSLPSRERGLKPGERVQNQTDLHVAPLAGAWIETLHFVCNPFGLFVAPLAGAWIETHFNVDYPLIQIVAPLAGAWIETPLA